MYKSATDDAYSGTCDDFQRMPFIGLIVAIVAAGAAATLWLARPLPIDAKRRQALTEAVAAVDRELAANLELMTMFDQTRQAIVLTCLELVAAVDKIDQNKVGLRAGDGVPVVQDLLQSLRGDFAQEWVRANMPGVSWRMRSYSPGSRSSASSTSRKRTAPVGPGSSRSEKRARSAFAGFQMLMTLRARAGVRCASELCQSRR